MTQDDKILRVEVAYATPESQVLLEVSVPRGTTLGEAIRRSGILARFPEIDLLRNRIGVFGELARLNHPVQNGDRVEIYRPLTVDPKTVRQQRARRTPLKSHRTRKPKY